MIWKLGCDFSWYLRDLRAIWRTWWSTLNISGVELWWNWDMMGVEWGHNQLEWFWEALLHGLTIAAVVNPTQYIDIDISWLVNGKWGLNPLPNQVGNSKLSTTPGAMHGIPDVPEKGGWHWVDSRLLAMFFDLLAGVKNCLPGGMDSDGNFMRIYIYILIYIYNIIYIIYI